MHMHIKLMNTFGNWLITQASFQFSAAVPTRNIASHSNTRASVIKLYNLVSREVNRHTVRHTGFVFLVPWLRQVSGWETGDQRCGIISSRQRLRSANPHQLMVLRHRRSTFGRRAFSVTGPMEWNSLPHSLRDPARSTDGFKSALKTQLFAAQKDV